MFMSGDARFDGRFVTGVTTTGVYCLPSCRARKPNPGNVRFFERPEDAESAGFRPCRRCRPDDFYRDYDPDREALVDVADRIRRSPGRFAGTDDAAAALGCGTTRMNDLFHRYFHRSAGRFISEARVAAACRQLIGTDERVADIALACGFGSLSAFNDCFRRHAALSPSGYRGLREGGDFVLNLPPGLRAVNTLRFQARDSESICERFDGTRLLKAISLEGRAVVLEMAAQDQAVVCRLMGGGGVGVTGMVEAHRAACRMLGLAPDPAPFEAMVRRTPRLKGLTEGRSGLRIPQTAAVFEGLAWAIIGQQINLRFAFQLRRHLTRLAGQPVNGLYTHPTPAQVALLDYSDLTALKYSRRKAEYLIDTARLVAAGTLPAETFPDAPVDWVRKSLEAVRGLGAWSSNYVAMRACGFSDCVPLGDTGLTSGLQRLFHLAQRPGPEETLRLMEAFRPYRSFAAFHLWQIMGGGA